MKYFLGFFDLGDRWVFPFSIFFLIVPIFGTIFLFLTDSHRPDFSSLKTRPQNEIKSPFKIGGDSGLSPGQREDDSFPTGAEVGGVQKSGFRQDAVVFKENPRPEPAKPLPSNTIPESSPEMEKAENQLDELSITSDGLLGKDSIIPK